MTYINSLEVTRMRSAGVITSEEAECLDAERLTVKRLAAREFKTPSPFAVKLWEANDRLCGLCGQDLALNELSMDHVVPKSKGGKEDNNLLPSHYLCNFNKSDRFPTQEELDCLAQLNAKLLKG